MAWQMHTWRNGQDSNLAPLAYAQRVRHLQRFRSVGTAPLCYNRSGYEVEPGGRIRTGLL